MWNVTKVEQWNRVREKKKMRIIAQKVGRCKNYEIIIPDCISSIYRCIVPSCCVCFWLGFRGLSFVFRLSVSLAFSVCAYFCHMCEEEMFKKPFKRHLALGNVCSTNKGAKWEEKTTNQPSIQPTKRTVLTAHRQVPQLYNSVLAFCVHLGQSPWC